MTSSEYVDWRLAASTGARLAPPGPKVSAGEAAAIVSDLRAAAVFAHEPIAQATRLSTPADAPAALVVDRSSWIEANLQTFAAVMDPVVARMREAGRHTPAAAKAIGAKVSGAEAGAVLSFLATKVLGQYDLAPNGTPRLLLVAPNIVEAERELEVDPGDFRRWVAMHEETHRVQFTAVPWLREHILALMQELADGVAGSPEELVERLAEAGKHLREALGPGGQGPRRALPHCRAAAEGRRRHGRDGAARRACRRHDGRGRAVGDPLGRLDPGAVHRAAPTRAEQRRPGHPPAHGARCEDRSVRRGRRLRPGGGLLGRARRFQRGVDLRADAADRR
jgi:plastocyanin